MGDGFELDGLPLRWQVPPVTWRATGGTALTAVAGPRTDLFVDPAGSEPKLSAPRLLGAPSGDFTLTARVGVEFAGAFDAGVLLLHGADHTWGKLCFEYSPQGEPMVVSVVTRGVSDDANAFIVDGSEVWLRIARRGDAYAFHASTDGKRWLFVRLPGVTTVGLAVQSPTGDGCTVTFSDLRYAAETLIDLCDGT